MTARGFWTAIYLIVGLGAVLAGIGIMVYAVLLEWPIGMLLVGLVVCIGGFATLGADETEFESPAQFQERLKALRRALGKE
jgi:hypothetical protein